MGAGFNALAEAGVRNAERQSDQKRQISDEEREQRLADHNGTIATLQKNMAAAHAAGDQDALTEYQTQLNQVVADRTALFHPDNGPGALAHLGKMVWEKVHGKPAPPQTQDQGQAASLPNTASVKTPALPPVAGQPTAPPSSGQAPTLPIPGAEASALPSMGGGVTLPAQQGPKVTQRPQTPADVKQRMATDLSYGTPAAPANPSLVYRKQLQEALPHLSPEELDKAVAIHAGFEAKPVDRPDVLTPYGKPIQDANGAWVQPFRDHSGTVENHPLPAGYKPPLASAHMTNQAQLRKDYAKAIGKNEEDLDFKDDQNMVSLIKQAGTGTTVGTHIAFVPQKDGSIVAQQVQTTSRKDFGGQKLPTTPPGSSTPSPAAPKSNQPTAPTPGGLKARVPSTGKTKAGVVQSGQVVGGRATPPETKAKSAVDAAQSSYLDVKKASDDPNSLNDKGVLLAWLRGRVNRVTQSEISSVSSLGGAQLAIENGVARITQGQMSPTQRKWFLQSAKDNYDIAREVYSKYQNPQQGGGDNSGGGNSDMVMATIPGVGTKPIHRSQVEAFKAKYPNGTVDENGR